MKGVEHKVPTVQSILQAHWAKYEQGHRLPQYVRAAVHALLSCRTSVLGGHVRRCPEGQVEGVWYNACRHRFCPQCAYLALERWLRKTKARLLATDHYHAVFTLPHELHALWLLNVVVMANLLFGAVRETLFELLGDKKYLGATAGVILALHTHGQSLILHPHLHALITGGGWSVAGWKAVTNGFLLPGRVVMALFRGKLLAAIRKALHRGELALPEGESVQRLENLLNRLGRKKWHVHLMERYAHGAGVATYVARYLRGGPIHDARLLAEDGAKITFRYRNHRDPDAGGRGKPDTMTLPVETFIQRLLLHVTPPRLHVVRAYGLYAGNAGEKREPCRKFFGQGPEEIPEAFRWEEHLEKRDGAQPTHCPVCGQRLVRVKEVAPVRDFALRRGWDPPHQRAGPPARGRLLSEAA